MVAPELGAVAEMSYSLSRSDTVCNDTVFGKAEKAEASFSGSASFVVGHRGELGVV